jgi:hypothetical protein
MNKFYELNVGEIKKKAYNEGHKARTEEIIKIAEGMKKLESPLHDAHQFYQVKDYNQVLTDLIEAIKK